MTMARTARQRPPFPMPGSLYEANERIEDISARLAEIDILLDRLYSWRQNRHLEDEEFSAWVEDRNTLLSERRLKGAEVSWLKNVRQRMRQRAPLDATPLSARDRELLGKKRRISDRQWTLTLLKILDRFEPEDFTEDESTTIERCKRYLDESKLF